MNGVVKVSGSKNAALPILAATLLTNKKCVIKNVPNIKDVHTMIEILKSIGAEVSFRNNVVTIRAGKIKNTKLPEKLSCELRASILVWGPLLARAGKVESSYPGGCVLGRRPIDTHVQALQKLGVKFSIGRNVVKAAVKKLKGEKFTLNEFSVTGTENIVMAAVLASGKTKVRLAATEPHVVDLCNMLNSMGAKISGIGSHVLVVKGVKHLRGLTHRVISDYLEVGTFTLAAVLTKGNVTIKNIVPEDLELFWTLLRETGANFTLKEREVIVRPAKKLRAVKRLQTAIHPGFPTDLQAPFAVLLTQCEGESLVHETLFEERFKYLPELAKMGAKFSVLNPHQVVINGPRPLRGAIVESCDLRAGAAMVLAALAARGKSTVKHIEYIDRGYEEFEKKFASLDADIKRI